MATVGIVGGTGPAGRGVAVRLAAGGHDVVLGSREASRAAEVAGTLQGLGTGRVSGAGNDEAAAADVVVVATPWDSAVASARALRDALAGKVVISMVNALQREGRELVPLYPPRGSMAAQIAAALPDSRVVGAFHHLPAAEMGDLNSGLEADVVIFGDDAPALEIVSSLISDMPGLRPIVAGSMSLAAPIESFTAVCISINIRHKVHSYVRLAGMGEG